MKFLVFSFRTTTFFFHFSRSYLASVGSTGRWPRRDELRFWLASSASTAWFVISRRTSLVISSAEISESLDSSECMSCKPSHRLSAVITPLHWFCGRRPGGFGSIDRGAAVFRHDTQFHDRQHNSDHHRCIDFCQYRHDNTVR